MALTITSVNCTFTLSVGVIFPTPVELKQWAVNDFISGAEVQVNETMRGVDGHFTGGFIFPEAIETRVSLMGDSVSKDIFDTWYNTMLTIKETMTANGVLKIPSIQKKYTMTKGYLVSHKIFPDVQNLVQAPTYTIRWGQVVSEAL